MDATCAVEGSSLTRRGKTGQLALTTLGNGATYQTGQLALACGLELTQIACFCLAFTNRKDHFVSVHC